MRHTRLTVEIIEVVEHEIHVLLLLALEVVYDPLVLVHFDPDVCICLSRNRPWLNEVVLVHQVAPLCCAHVWPITHAAAERVLFLALTADLVVVFEVFILFHQLIITHIERVPSNRVVCFGVLVEVAKDPVLLVLIVHVVVRIPTDLGVELVSKNRRVGEGLVREVAVLLHIAETVVCVDVLRILHPDQVLFGLCHAAQQLLLWRLLVHVVLKLIFSQQLIRSPILLEIVQLVIGHIELRTLLLDPHFLGVVAVFIVPVTVHLLFLDGVGGCAWFALSGVLLIAKLHVLSLLTKVVLVRKRADVEEAVAVGLYSIAH